MLILYLSLQNEIQRWESNTAENIRCFLMMATIMSTGNLTCRWMIMQQGQMNCTSATSLLSVYFQSVVVSRHIDTAAPVPSTHPAVNMTIMAFSMGIANMNGKNNSRLISVLNITWNTYGIILCTVLYMYHIIVYIQSIKATSLLPSILLSSLPSCGFPVGSGHSLFTRCQTFW